MKMHLVLAIGLLFASVAEAQNSVRDVNGDLVPNMFMDSPTSVIVTYWSTEMNGFYFINAYTGEFETDWEGTPIFFTDSACSENPMIPFDPRGKVLVSPDVYGPIRVSQGTRATPTTCYEWWDNADGHDNPGCVLVTCSDVLMHMISESSLPDFSGIAFPVRRAL